MNRKICAVAALVLAAAACAACIAAVKAIEKNYWKTAISKLRKTNN